MKILLTIYAAINLIAFILFGVDKRRAIRHSWRISEACLLLSAAMFGGLGAFLGMQLFRHKTKHPRFVILVPVFMIFQLVILFYLCRKLCL
ncbi:MAG: DUF1294 domain-containing protein [Saccharofermentans sp.]|jgi:uncharacterized membrane protein YsdA (DUF1294 family)|nr:DUF1294 domain-containing protein [Mageeibacillus sp.]MCI1263402.1 DUF1294 domain-containing protein [Saccharofermentans sp.]MCI1274855.1 DUF1294 domain-containing protein [Saccharofermentans sp.]MCI1769071.1 DUF1294 domain-containing protein [Mageeibacillus sp.]MCI2044115.1 DUF1294 domain-containing protein [Mageeibacillus sp.]